MMPKDMANPAPVTPPGARPLDLADPAGGRGEEGDRGDPHEADGDLEAPEHRQQVTEPVEQEAAEEAAEAEAEQEGHQHDAELVVRVGGEGDDEKAYPGDFVGEGGEPLEGEADKDSLQRQGGQGDGGGLRRSGLRRRPGSLLRAVRCLLRTRAPG